MIELNPIQLLKNYFNKIKKKNEQQLKVLENVLTINGFDKINFPILIIEGKCLEYVEDLKEYAIDPDLYFHEFPSDFELLDSEGNLWTWKYDRRIKSNMPGELKKISDLEEVKELILVRFGGSKFEDDINKGMDNIHSIKVLLNFISDKI